ncbi:MAG: CBS domain-containing protein [Coriobacteriia bacterium]|nr:CBS domain-containing protein [Coriobacteriia bacterium]
MIYLSTIIKKPVYDSQGNILGRISDLAISTGEVFPRITSLAFVGPGKTPFMISWRKYVDVFDDDDGVKLKVPQPEIRFSYLQPSEVLLARDLLNRQIVDTQGLKVVRVNDLKLSQYGNQLRLLGAEVGIRGILRGLSPLLEKGIVGISKLFKHEIGEQIIAWNYMDLLDRDLSKVQLSVSHKRLDELHPADVADILEQLDPQQRAHVFQQLDENAASEAVAEMEDEYQAEFIEDLSSKQASKVLGNMDPDDAVEIVRDLPYEKAEKLLRLMGVEDATEIRQLLGYKDGTAGGMMTPQFVAVHDDDTVNDTINVLRDLEEAHPPVHYVYVLDKQNRFSGVVSLKSLALTNGKTLIKNVMYTDNLISVSPDEDEDEVSEAIFKYDLTAMPVVDEHGELSGIVTTEDAWDAIEDDVKEEKKQHVWLKRAGIVVLVLVLLAIYTVVVLNLGAGLKAPFGS